ncbi:MAG: hypothetical protein U0176_13525 [Bacteroidia bacterium]
MKQGLYLMWAIAATLTLGACTQASKDENKDKNPPKDSLAEDRLPVDGSVKRVYALGYHFGGVPSTDWKLYEEIRYNDAGQEIQLESFYDGVGSIMSTQYDSSGHEILKKLESSAHAPLIEYRSTWNADHTEQRTEEFAHAESRVVFKTVRHLDQAGTELWVEDEDLHAIDAPISHTLKHVRDAKGRVTEDKETFLGKEIVGTRYSYGAAGNPVKIERMDSEGKLSQTEFFAYDESGRKTTRWFQDHHAYLNTKQLEARFTYDAQGRLMKEVHYRGACDEASEQVGKCPILETVTYTYDDQGRLATEEHLRSGQEPATMKKRFEYFGKVPAGK